MYVGESDCFERRLYQHGYSLRIKDKCSSLVVHEKLNPGHVIDLENAEMAVQVNNLEDRKIMESFLIKNTPNCVNLEEGSIKVDSILNNFLNKSNICKKVV